MSDTIEDDRPVTRRDLMERGIDAVPREKAGHITVSKEAGGLSFSSALEVMDFAKMMAVSGNFVRKDFRGNPGMCLAVTFQAIEWHMSPFAVASKAYVVNDQVAYESQLIHAIIESRAPLQHRLDCEYDGEGLDRVCVVTGQFTNGDVREYRSPKLKDISPRNSPLWKTDPDQQLWYYASRAWARKWCPDVLMGIYTPDEARELPPSVDEGSGLHARLVGADVSREEGHRPGHVESELDQIATVGTVIEGGAVEAAAVNDDAGKKPARGARKKAAAKAAETPAGDAEEKAAADRSEDPAEDDSEEFTEHQGELPAPKTAAEYAAYAERWLALATEADEVKARWKREMKMRNDLGVTSEQRAPVEEKKNRRLEMLS